MLTKSFSLYFQETLAFVRSFKFKHEIQNEALNGYMKKLGHAVDIDPSKWKYNLNLTGEYHPLDEKMTVTSSDTKEKINFDKATLLDHSRTLLRHQLGQPDYKDLVSRYPKNAILIQGIVKPLSMDDVLKAKDWQLLQWDKSYLSINEVSLIRRIQDHVDIYVARNWNPARYISDPLYPAAFIGNMMQHLVVAVMVIRLELTATNEVDQWHLWRFLGDHYELDKHRNTLKLDQALWLYRNIENIRATAGREDTFLSLIKHITKPSGLKISKLDYVQLDTDLLSNNHRTALYSKTDYDATEASLSVGDTLNTERMFKDTVEKGSYNSYYLEADTREALRVGESLMENRLPTKHIKADEDGSLFSQITDDMSLKTNYWGYLAHLDYFKVDYTINIPNSGSVFLSARDAFILYIYSTNRSIGKVVASIPDFNLQGVMPVVLPTVAELKSKVEFSSKWDIDEVFAKWDAEKVPLVPVTTAQEFLNLVTKIASMMSIFESFETIFENPYDRAMGRNLTASYTRDIRVNLSDGVTSYETWLFDKGISSSSLKDKDWHEVSKNILAAVLDFKDNTSSVGNYQKSMLEIVDNLTSYNIDILSGEGTDRHRELNNYELMMFDLSVDMPISNTIHLNERMLSEHNGDIHHYLEGDLDLVALFSFDELVTLDIDIDDEQHITEIDSNVFEINVSQVNLVLDLDYTIIED